MIHNGLHKMMSWTHQMMSQQQHVVGTTPGQSQKLLKTSDTVNLTEKIQSDQQGHKMQHNDGKDSFLGSLLVLPVKLWKGIAG